MAWHGDDDEGHTTPPPRPFKTVNSTYFEPTKILNKYACPGSSRYGRHRRKAKDEYSTKKPRITQQPFPPMVVVPLLLLLGYIPLVLLLHSTNIVGHNVALFQAMVAVSFGILLLLCLPGLIHGILFFLQQKALAIWFILNLTLFQFCSAAEDTTVVADSALFCITTGGVSTLSSYFGVVVTTAVAAVGSVASRQFKSKQPKKKKVLSKKKKSSYRLAEAKSALDLSPSARF